MKRRNLRELESPVVTWAWRAIFSLLGVLLVAAFLMPSQADAAPPKYGPWFPPPGSQGGVYQADYDPLNERHSELSEQKTFACIQPNGDPVGADTRAILGSLIYQATNVYTGNLNYDDWGGNDDLDEDLKGEENLGYPTGEEGMREFLQDERSLLARGLWAPYEMRKAQSADGDNGWDQESPRRESTYEIGDSGIEIAWDNGEDIVKAGALSAAPPELQKKIVDLIDWAAENPLLLGSPSGPNDQSYIPEGCALGEIGTSDVSFSDFMSDPTGALTSIFFGITAKPINFLYQKFFPYAWRYTFWTPHSERGDYFWDQSLSCSPTDPNTDDTCQGGAPLGFDKSNLDKVDDDGRWYVSIAELLQWLISGTYFLILFTAAVLYIFRGNRATSMNVITLIPKLLLSIIVTISLSFVVGGVISFANMITQGIFDTNDTATIGLMNTMLLDAGFAVGSDSDILTQIVEIIVGACVFWFSVIFIISALLRQVLLIVLIIVGPLAAFCLINDRWRPRFNQWVRALLVVAFMPVVMAFILKIGISINPALANPKEPQFGGVAGIVGMFLIIATLWAMARVVRAGFSMLGASNQSLFGRFSRSGGSLLRSAGMMGAKAGGPVGIIGGGLAIGAGSALGAAGAASSLGDKATGRFVPSGRAGGGPSGGMSGIGGRAAGLLGAGGAAAGAAKATGPLGAAGTGLGGVNDRINAFMNRKSGEFSQRARQQNLDGTFNRSVSADEVADLRRTEAAMRQAGMSDAAIEQELGGKVSYDRKSGGYVQKQSAESVIRDFNDRRARASGGGPAARLPSGQLGGAAAGGAAAAGAAGGAGPASRPVPTNPTSAGGGAAPRAPGAAGTSGAAPTVSEAEIAAETGRVQPTPSGQRKAIQIPQSPDQIAKAGKPKPPAAAAAKPPVKPAAPKLPKAGDIGKLK